MPCTTILVGKKASYDGSNIISRNDDGLFEAKKLKVTIPNKQPRKYKTIISHLNLELPDNPVRYTSAPNVSTKNGTWPACGINEFNVAMTATETITSNPLVMGADPYVTYKKKEGKTKETAGGIGEEDIVTLVLPYVKSAREGVLRLGSLLEQYGTYESNGIAFCDSDDIWWMETIGGHHWIARRVPDDRVVIMPNQFGLDNFDFDDAYGKQEENLCSDDLRGFIEKNHLYVGRDGKSFNPRLAFGSHSDSDHIYNTPRAWFMARYFLPRSFRWDGEEADFTPESNDIPWSFIPEQKVTIEDVRYLLGSYYQGTPYNPYDSSSQFHGKYRTIGVPNSDICGILQIRGYMPDSIKGIEWISMGGSGFTACFPVYSNVESFPEYIGGTTDTVSTDYMYWTSRIIAALTDAHIGNGLLLSERYNNMVWNKSVEILNEYDKRICQGENQQLLFEANKKITDMVKKESDKALNNILNNASEKMKIRYHRGDN